MDAATGADNTRHRLTSYTSPSAIASRIATTPSQNSDSDRLDVHDARAGPSHGAPGQGRAGRTDANRAHVTDPSNPSTTAQNPDESSAARSLVTSTSPVARRPPTTASGSTGEAYDEVPPMDFE